MPSQLAVGSKMSDRASMLEGIRAFYDKTVKPLFRGVISPVPCVDVAAILPEGPAALGGPGRISPRAPAAAWRHRQPCLDPFRRSDNYESCILANFD